jgi:hypothetical protein
MGTSIVKKIESLCDKILENLLEDRCDASGRSKVHFLVLMLACG